MRAPTKKRVRKAAKPGRKTATTLCVKLNACVSSKLSLPFSNSKFTIAEFDFQAIADASNNIGTISLAE